MRSAHIEGTLGELVDGSLQWLKNELGVVQVARNGHLFDEADVPLEALRETRANVLTHRSLSPAMENTSVSIHVTAATVSVFSPGGLALGVDPQRLGLVTMPTPRNYALVRLCGQLTTPTGARIVESQASGISRSDRICRDAETAPLVLVVKPAEFTAVALRGRLDYAGAAAIRADLAADPVALRILAFMRRLEEVRGQDPSSVLHGVVLDASLSARLLDLGLPERAIPVLSRLTDLGVLRARWPSSQGLRGNWRMASPRMHLQQPPQRALLHQPHLLPQRCQQSRIVAVRQSPIYSSAIYGAPGQTLRPRDVQIGLAERAVKTTIRAALDAGLLEPTTAVAHDPGRGYRLTELGRRQLRPSE